MTDHVRTEAGYHLAEFGGICDVDHAEVHVLWKVLDEAGREIVDSKNARARLYEPLGNVRSDEPGSARHDDFGRYPARAMIGLIVDGFA